VIREKSRGFGANVWDLIGNQIIFQLENTIDQSSWSREPLRDGGLRAHLGPQAVVAEGSPESVLVATLVGKTSPQAGEKMDTTMGNLTKGGNWWLVRGMKPTSEGNGTRRRCLVLGGSGHG
jgi:hypothetical protein